VTDRGDAVGLQNRSPGRGDVRSAAVPRALAVGDGGRPRNIRAADGLARDGNEALGLGLQVPGAGLGGVVPENGRVVDGVRQEAVGIVGLDAAE
jgi:hypothetical protein